jgi:hypothetical protein
MRDGQLQRPRLIAYSKRKKGSSTFPSADRRLLYRLSWGLLSLERVRFLKPSPNSTHQV